LWDRATVESVDGKRALAALVVSLIVAVSCGGATSTTGTASPSSAATAAAQSTGTGLPATARPTASGATGQAQLGELLAASRLSQYKITYRYTVGTVVSDQSWYFKPPKQRIDFATGSGAQAFVISFYSLPEGSYYCFVVGTAKQCTAIQGAGSPLDQNAGAVFIRSMMQNPSSYAGTFVESRTFAGQAGLCYDVNGTATVVAGVSSGRFCYTREGLLLYSSFGPTGSQITMEATNVSTTVPDSDFDLPAKP